MWGGQIADETGQLVVLNKDPYRQNAIAALTWLKDIYTDPKYAVDAAAGRRRLDRPEQQRSLAGGKIGITNNAGTVFAKAVVDKNPVADDTYLILQPKGLGPDARVAAWAPGGAMNFFIMKGAKNREAAEQLIRYLMHARDLQADVQHQHRLRVSGARVGLGPARDHRERTTPSTSPTSGRQIFDDPSGYLGSSLPGPADAAGRTRWTTPTS